MTDRMKDIGIGLVIGFFFAALEMIVTYMIVHHKDAKKETC